MIWLKTKLYGFISSLLYPLLLLVALMFDDHTRLINYLVSLGVLSLLWSILLFRRYRLIEDTESTTLNSAAQGYVELQGKASLYEGEVARSFHLEVPPMVWHRRLFLSSWSGFLLHDDKGRCTIDPRSAEVITPLYIYNQYLYNAIYPGETIYALGRLETLKKHRTEWERKGLISRKLKNWKSNKFYFLDYFDKNKDGFIDEGELQTARQAAERVVDSEIESTYQEPATHIVSRDTDGRPFILSSISPEALVRRYKIAMLGHLAAWLLLSLLVFLS